MKREPKPTTFQALTPEQNRWLFSRRADFWLACGGASVGLLASMLLIFLHGDRELDALDFVLSEFHLGATYAVVIHRRLWRHRQVDVLVIPLMILALTYVLSLSGQTILLTSIAMYAAVWHRGRQSLGVARFYQRQAGGPLSRTHEILFRGAIYLPMLAGLLAYTHLAPLEYEGEPYLALKLGAEFTSIVGFASAAWVTAYLAWTLWRNRRARLITNSLIKGSERFDKLSMNGKYSIIERFAPFALRLSKGERRLFQRPNANQPSGMMVHPGEWWVVLAHAVAFGSGYALGAANASFLLVLAVHHEVQYLYFTYAMDRRSAKHYRGNTTGIDSTMTGSDSDASYKVKSEFRNEINHASSFAVWPVIGFVGAIAGGWLDLDWLGPLGIGGLFCHYWLDGSIWTRRSLNA